MEIYKAEKAADLVQKLNYQLMLINDYEKKLEEAKEEARKIKAIIESM